MTALSGDAPERNPATTPQPVICRMPSASAAPVSRDQTPAQAIARCASQKTSIHTNTLPVKVRASAPALKCCADHGRPQERAVHRRSIAEISDPDPGVLDAELAALGGSVTRRAARDVYAELQGR